MKEKITVEEAYGAMFLYLDHLYQLTKSDDLAGFLGSMSTLPDGKPVDSAVWDDWLECVEKARLGADTRLILTK